MVEYEALILGLKVALELKIADIEIYGDSLLIVNQVKGTYDTKDEKLIPYRVVVIELLYRLDMYTIMTIPRTNNRYANAMKSATSLVPIELEDEETILTICKLSSPYYTTHLHSIFSCLIANNDAFQDWYFDIYSYLRDQSISSRYTKNDRLRLRRTTMTYVIIGDILYRRSFDGALLRCLTYDEIATTLEQAHDGLCGGHFHAKALYTKILRIGYYWATMEEDCQTHVKACVPSQKHANLEKQPTQEFNSTISPWPFAT